jgi:hypothetical protein
MHEQIKNTKLSLGYLKERDHFEEIGLYGRYY